MSYVTIKDLPEIQTVNLSGNEYMMVTDETSNVSSKFSVDSMVVYVGEHFDNTVDGKLELKVDKITGKGLSTEDFSTLEKSKLNSLENYVHQESVIEPGDYTKVTINNLGHAIAGSNPNTLLDYGITDAINASTLGSPNGVATLDDNGVVNLVQLPVNILEYSTLSSFPSTGESNKIYISLDTNKAYRWNINIYAQLGSLVDSVSGRTGNIILSKADVQLNNVNNSADVNKNVLSATKLTTARTINNVSFNGTADIIIEANDPNKVTSNALITGGTYTKITYDDKGLVLSGSSLSDTDIPNIDASKITSGIINADRLPSYVDDVLEYSDLLNFPAVGEQGKIYLALDTNKAYRWAGSVYVYITSGAVDSVAGKTGVVTLEKSDVQLNNVDNTSDIDKPISSDTQTALNLKADKATTLAGYSIGDAYTKNEVQTVLPKVGFDTTNVVAPEIGQFAWNQDEHTLDLGLNGAELQVGQEHLIRVRNNTLSAITNGSASMATGTIGNSGRITIGNANISQANAKYILGVATELIPAGADGFVTAFGKVRGIDTTGAIYGETWVDGDVLYVKDSGNGALTKVTPTDEEVKLPIAIVVHAHANGTIFVRVNSIDENHAKAELTLKANLDSPTLTTPNIGVATGVSFNNITGLATSEPIVSGIAAVGSSTLVAKQDHVHPAQTNVSGNAGTATKLETARTINGVEFDGSENIVIPSQAYITNTEYTTELIRNTKQVYGIEVDIGAMPNAGVKDITFVFNSSYTYWIDDQNSYCDNATASYPLNYAGNIGESLSCFLDRTNNKIKILTSDDKSSFNGKIILLYTK